MVSLRLPSFPAKTRVSASGRQIFCPLRRRYVALTPEEWVRQHFIHYLTHHLGYPAALMGAEVSLQVGSVRRRADLVVYHREGGTPRVVVELKAPEVPITQAVFTQIASYNSVLRSDYLFVSNGVRHFALHMDYVAQTSQFLPALPRYEDL